jgi:hypothetical protein
MSLALNSSMAFDGSQSRATTIATNIIALLLVIGVGTASAWTLTLPFTARNAPKCHGLNHHLPSAPADHTCCIVSHQHALLKKVITVQCVCVSSLARVTVVVPPGRWEQNENRPNLNPSPPIVSPLRI